MAKAIKIILIVFGIVFLISIISSFIWRRQLKSLEGMIPLETFYKNKTFSPEQILKTQNGNGRYKEFTTFDKKLKLNYPSGWLEIKKEDFEKIISSETVKNYGWEVLFSAQKPGVKMSAQLVICEENFTTEKTFEEIIREMKESNLRQGWNMEIINPEIKSGETIFEARYQKPNRYDIHSKEKIIFFEPKEGKKTGYLISVVTFDKDWLELSQEIDFIFNSIQFID